MIAVQYSYSEWNTLACVFPITPQCSRMANVSFVYEQYPVRPVQTVGLPRQLPNVLEALFYVKRTTGLLSLSACGVNLLDVLEVGPVW